MRTQNTLLRKALVLSAPLAVSVLIAQLALAQGAYSRRDTDLPKPLDNGDPLVTFCTYDEGTVINAFDLTRSPRDIIDPSTNCSRFDASAPDGAIAQTLGPDGRPLPGGIVIGPSETASLTDRNTVGSDL